MAKVLPPSSEVICTYRCPKCGQENGFPNTEFVARYNQGRPRFGVRCRACGYGVVVSWRALDRNSITRLTDDWQSCIEPYGFV